MKRFIAVAGAAIVFSCAASAASAQRDSVERGTRMDTDALRDDVRTNRLQIPQASPGCRAASATFPQSKRKSQVQEKRRKQSIAPGRLNAMPLHKKPMQADAAS